MAGICVPRPPPPPQFIAQPFSFGNKDVDQCVGLPDNKKPACYARIRKQASKTIDCSKVPPMLKASCRRRQKRAREERKAMTGSQMWKSMFGNLGNFNSQDMNKSTSNIYNKAKNQFKLDGSVPQSELNKAYKSIDVALSRRVCDPECQKKRERMKILKQIGDIDKMLISAPKRVEDLESRYYELADGDDWYRTWKEEKLNTEKKKQHDELLKDHNRDIKNMRIDLHNYNTQYTYVTNLGDLSDKYQTSNKDLETQSKLIINDKNTNFRKALYEQEFVEKYLRANNFLFKLYWGLILFYIIFFIVMDKQMKNMKLWLNVLILAVIPYILSMIHEIFKYVIDLVLPMLAL